MVALERANSTFIEFQIFEFQQPGTDTTSRLLWLEFQVNCEPLCGGSQTHSFLNIHCFVIESFFFVRVIKLCRFVVITLSRNYFLFWCKQKSPFILTQVHSYTYMAVKRVE